MMSACCHGLCLKTVEQSKTVTIYTNFMKRSVLFQPILWAMMLILISCQKEILKNNSSDQLISKINSWLEKQKTGLLAFKAANVNLLRENLEYSNLRVEKSEGGEQIIIIPISEKFKAQKISNKSSIPNLVLLLNSSGEIKKGNVVLFHPKTSGIYTQVPDNTFFDIFNTSKVKCDGRFQFISVAGHWDYQLDYSNGSLNSYGFIEAQQDSNGTTRSNAICINWYLVTKYYVDGILVLETREYVGTTCSDQCGDGSYQSLCPDGSDSGGSNEENCNNPINGSVSSETEGILTTNDQVTTRTKTYRWVIYKGGGNTWRFTSQETGIHKKVNNEWQWESLTHNSVTRSGLMLGGDVQCTSHTGTPILGMYNAAMTVHFNLQFSAVCRGFPITTNGDFNTTKFFNVND